MSPFRFYWIGCFLLITIASFAQTPEDSTLTHKSYVELDSIGEYYYTKGDFKKALPYYQAKKEKAATQYGTQDSMYVPCLGDLGLVWGKLADYKQAEKYIQEALDLSRKLWGEGSPNYVSYLNKLANVYARQGAYKQAEEAYFKATTFYKGTIEGDNSIFISSFGGLGMLYQRLGAYSKAEPLLIKTRDMVKQTKGDKHVDYSTALNNLANFYFMTGGYEEAVPLLIEAIEIDGLLLGEEHPYYAQSLNNLALLYKKLRKHDQAESLLLQTLAIDKKMLGTKHPYYAQSLSNLGDLYEETQRYAEAEPLYLEALEIKKAVLGVDHPNYAQSLSGLAVLYQSMKRYKDSEKYLLEGKRITERVYGKDHMEYTAFLNNLSAVYIASKDYDKAKELLDEALEIEERMLENQHPSYLKTLNVKGTWCLENNQLDKAWECMVWSVACNTKNFKDVFPDAFLGDSLAKPIAVENLSKLEIRNNQIFLETLHLLLEISYQKYQHYLSVGEAQKAASTLEEHYAISQASIAISERIRNGFISESNKLGILKENTILVEYGLRAALSLSNEEVTKAFELAEQNKSILLADALKGNRAKVLGDLPDSLIVKESDLQNEKTLLEKQLQEVNEGNEQTNLIAKRNALQQEIDLFLNRLKDQYPKYHALKYEHITAKAQDVQQYLDTDDLFLEYWVADSMTYLFAIDKNGVTLLPLKIRQKELEKGIQKLRLALSNYSEIGENPKAAYEHYIQAADWCYQVLLAEILQDKKVQDLIIVTDGELGHLPFETFLTTPADQKGEDYTSLAYLIKDYNVSYHYSATLFVEAHRQISTNTATEGLLACAASYRIDSLEQIDSSLLKLRLPYWYELRQLLDPLPSAEQEVKVLAEDYEGTFLLKNAANEAFFKQNAANYSIIHLAMHGVLHPRSAMLSSLAFTENRDSVEDNFLQAYEIAQMNLNAQLVVLSACETGYGDFEQGEGIISLARSFMYAGVPSLVVSLWQVNDEVTAIIMKDFYKNMAEGMPKDQALREAKLTYLADARGWAAHPAFWSAFIQLGDKSPIAINKKGSSFYPMLIAGILLLVVLILIYRRFGNNHTDYEIG